MRELYWKNLTEYLSEQAENAEEIVESLRNLYSLYSTDICTWLGGLFDPDIGGFYYSNSAKNTYGYLPDIESTNQALVFLQNSGLIESYDSIPSWVKEKIERFICYLQDPENGFFYHLQWDKALVESYPNRLSRDYDEATNIAQMLDFKLPYRIEKENRGQASKRNDGYYERNIPAHLKSKDAFMKYLQSFDWKNDAYRATSTILSQYSLLHRQYLTDTALNFIDSLQNPKTGLFESRDNPCAIDSYFAISHFHIIEKRPLKYVDRAISAVFERFDGDENKDASYVYHVWSSMSNIMSQLRESYDEKENKNAEKILPEIFKIAPKAIDKTAQKLRSFQKDDGSFSYYENITSSFSQGMPVAIPGTNEGDVNATCLCSTAVTRMIFKSLNAHKHYVPIFDNSDYSLFLQSLKPPKEGI